MVQTILEQKAITHHKRNFIWNTPQSKNPDKLFNYKLSLQQKVPINYSTIINEVWRQQTPSRSYLVSETDIVFLTKQDRWNTGPQRHRPPLQQKPETLRRLQLSDDLSAIQTDGSGPIEPHLHPPSS